MSSNAKRYIFFSLFLVFSVYSFFIAGPVTEFTTGKSALTVEAKEGKLLFQKYNCISCHQIYGLGGYMGPDLTNVMSAKGKGEVYVSAILDHGTKRMPDFGLTKTEVSALIGYLNYLDKTGLSPVKEFTINIVGTVSSPSHEK
jgi:nitric oxide reductase subunit C